MPKGVSFSPYLPISCLFQGWNIWEIGVFIWLEVCLQLTHQEHSPSQFHWCEILPSEIISVSIVGIGQDSGWAVKIINYLN